MAGGILTRCAAASIRGWQWRRHWSGSISKYGIGGSGGGSCVRGERKASCRLRPVSAGSTASMALGGIDLARWLVVEAVGWQSGLAAALNQGERLARLQRHQANRLQAQLRISSKGVSVVHSARQRRAHGSAASFSSDQAQRQGQQGISNGIRGWRQQADSQRHRQQRARRRQQRAEAASSSMRKKQCRLSRPESLWDPCPARIQP